MYPMNAIVLSSLGESPVVASLAARLGPVFQLQALQCLLSCHPASGFSFGCPEREVPWLARILRLHAGGLPRMALSQLLAGCRRSFAGSGLREAVVEFGVDVLSRVPVMAAGRPRMVAMCREALPLLATAASAADRDTGAHPGDPTWSNHRLALSVASVVCRVRAHPEWPGRDDLQLSLFLTDDRGRVAKRLLAFHGDLGGGGVWPVEQVVQSFDLRDATDEPQVYGAAIWMGEIELGTFSNVLEEVHEDLHREITGCLWEAMAEGGDQGGLLVRQGSRRLSASVEALITACVGRILAGLVGWLVPVAGGHRFISRSVAVLLPSIRCGFRSGNGAASRVMRVEVPTPCGGGGDYVVTLEWRLES
jgi:hypothetical protein